MPNGPDGALHHNGCSYLTRKAKPGTGGMISACKLRKEAFREVPTPTLKDHMSVAEANAEWAAYLGALSRVGWRNPVVDPRYTKE